MKPSTFKWALHLLGLAGTSAAAAIAYAFLLRPMEVESQQLRAAARQKTEFLATADDLSVRNRELKGQLKQTEQLLAELKQRIPDSAREADFLAQLADSAERTEVEIVDYRPAAAVEKDRHHELTIQLSAKGRYEAMCLFLDDLERLPRLCHVTGMEIDASRLASDVYEFELTLQVYFRPAGAAVAKNQGNPNG